MPQELYDDNGNLIQPPGSPTNPIVLTTARAGGVVYDDSGNPVTTAQEPDSLGKWLREKIGPNVYSGVGAVDVAIGAGKSILGTIEGGANLIRKIPVIGPALDMMPSYQPKTPVTLEPHNTAQQVGKTATDIAQFLVPSGTVTRTASALSKAAKFGPKVAAAVGLTGEALKDAAVASAQTGDVKKGAVAGMVSLGAGAAFKALQLGLKPTAESLETRLIKPGKADQADGFKASNVFKYGLGGSLPKSLEKTDTKIGQLSQQLHSALRADPNARVNVYQALFDAADDLDKSAIKNVGDQGGIRRAFEKMFDDIGEAFKNQGVPIGPNGEVDLAAGNILKQGVGEQGAWLSNPIGARMSDPDAGAKEKVANFFYRRLKEGIEKNAKGPVKAINSQLGDLIPIKHALIRRIPVEARQTAPSLGDLIALSHKNWGLTFTNRALQSGNVINAAHALSQFPNAANRIGTTGAALTSEGEQ